MTARVHPGETNSSFMMKGAIDFLLSDSKDARVLRSKYIFKIIPMLNPDGVIYGNYRCGLLGVDLNRRWKKPNKYLHPTIYHAKKLIQVFSEENEVIMFCDMHGHSMKKNVFMYACKSVGNIDDAKTNVFIRLFPYLLAKRNPIFSYKDSYFRLEKCKSSTARIVVFKECGILNSYTLEASFFGPNESSALYGSSSADQSSLDTHMGTLNLESLGRDLCKQLNIFFSPRTFRRKLDEVSNSIGANFFSRKVRVTETAKKSKISDKQDSDETVENIITRQVSEINIIKEEDEESEYYFDIQEAIRDVNEDLLDHLTSKDEGHDSDPESDSSTSENDDRKIEYLIKHKKKKKQKCEDIKPREMTETPFRVSNVTDTKTRPPSAQLKRTSLSPNGKIRKDHNHKNMGMKTSHSTMTRKGSLHFASFLRAPLGPEHLNVGPFKLEDPNYTYNENEKTNPVARITQVSGGFRKLNITKDSQNARIPKDRGFIITALGDAISKEVNGRVVYKSIIERTREQTSLLIKSNKHRRNRRQVSSVDQSNPVFEVINRHYESRNYGYSVIH